MQTNWGNIQACGQASYTETTANLQMLLQLSLSNLQYTKMMKLYLQHCMWKKKMLVAVHTSTINTVQREPEILTNSEIIKGFVCWMYQCLIKFLTKVHVYCLSEFSIHHKVLNKRYKCNIVKRKILLNSCFIQVYRSNECIDGWWTLTS